MLYSFFYEKSWGTKLLLLEHHTFEKQNKTRSNRSLKGWFSIPSKKRDIAHLCARTSREHAFFICSLRNNDVMLLICMPTGYVQGGPQNSENQRLLCHLRCILASWNSDYIHKCVPTLKYVPFKQCELSTLIWRLVCYACVHVYDYYIIHIIYILYIHILFCQFFW